VSQSHHLSHVVQRMFNQPLALHPSYGAMVVAALHSRLGIDGVQMAEGEFRYPGVAPRTESLRLDREAMEALAADGRHSARVRTEEREGKRKLFAEEESVAIIPVEGTLTKSWGLDPYSGVTGYDGIEAKLVAAQSDSSIKGIWMQFDSGGGDVAGLFPLMDLISKMTVRNGGRKPIYAMISDYAYSAAYALASAADKVFVPETGGAGSVGVITMHADFSRAYENEGINVTVIRSGERKAKPNSMEPIEIEDLNRIQGQIDRIRDMFAERVARDRGIPKSRVLKTEAVDYMGEDAKAIGFVDKIASDHQAWEQLQRAISAR
jgi:signal peptide peptidase SppA